MSALRLEDWIPQGVSLEIRGMLLRAYGPNDMALLDQDVLEIKLPNDLRIDVGWFPENDPNGRFVIRVFRRDRLKPIRSLIEERSPHNVAMAIGHLVEQYGPRPEPRAVPVSWGTSTSVRLELQSPEYVLA